MNLLGGTLVGLEGGFARVRFPGGAEAPAKAGEACPYPGAAVVVAVRPVDLRIVDPSTPGSLSGSVGGIERLPHAVHVRVELAAGGACRVATVECAAADLLPAPGSVVGLAFDPACGRVEPDRGRSPMRRGPDGPFLVDGRRS